MIKPIIGVTPLWDQEKQSVWMLPEYLFRKDGSSLKLFRRFIEESGRDN